MIRYNYLLLRDICRRFIPYESASYLAFKDGFAEQIL